LPGSLAEISALKPTQIGVGYREVCVKFHKLRRANGSNAVQKRLIPVIAGPGGHFYLRDGHHLTLALHLAGRKSVRVNVVDDWSDLGIEAFWRALDACNGAYPFDGNGRRQRYCRMPSNILCVDDDPFRSLAGALRRCGGYSKSAAPYADFAWTDFLRHRIDAHLLMRDFPAALARARELAASRAAEHLPGWLAPKAKAEAAPVSARAS
jgi:hypothetical protein